MSEYTRREFIRTVGAVGVGMCTPTIFGCFKKEIKARSSRANKLSDMLAVATGGGIDEMVRKAMDALGSMGKLVRSGDIVVIKPNIGWAQPPEKGASTNPQTVAALVKLCVEAGAKKVKVLDRPCDEIRRAYSESGIKSAAEKAGAVVPYIDNSRFAELEIPKGVFLTKWSVYEEVVEADVLINVPVAKVHNSSGLTLSLKNLMGVAGGNRGKWHEDIHTSIADFYSVVRCDLTVIDAYRIMLRNGPRGGRLSDVEVRKTIAICKDGVMADAYAAKELFGRKPESLGFIRQAHERGLGDMNYGEKLVNVTA